MINETKIKNKKIKVCNKRNKNKIKQKKIINIFKQTNKNMTILTKKIKTNKQ